MSNTQEIRFYVVMDSKVDKNGLSKVYLRFFHKNVKKDFFTGIKWPKEKFDKINESLLPRMIHDVDVHAYNMKIGQYKSIIHQVKMDAFVKNREIHIQQITDSLTNLTPYTDFVSFATTEAARLSRNNIISYDTYRRHRSSINRLVEFFGRENIGVHEITIDRIAEFDGFYRKKRGLGKFEQPKSNNTIAGYHKDIKTYLNKCVEYGMIEKNPYEKFKFKFVDGNREALTQEEVKKLMKIYDEKSLRPNHLEVLRRFLFSCLTGIRISDTHRVKTSNIKEGKLVFKPKKGLKYGKIVALPLPQAALRLIQGRDGLLFDVFADAYINRTLKIIAAYAQIEKNLSYHCARDTFGTIFIELGGDIKSLCDLMGHSSTKITEIYLKMADKRKQQLMNNFDSIF